MNKKKFEREKKNENKNLHRNWTSLWHIHDEHIKRANLILTTRAHRSCILATVISGTSVSENREKNF